jgi:hypothetical protein
MSNDHAALWVQSLSGVPLDQFAPADALPPRPSSCGPSDSVTSRSGECCLSIVSAGGSASRYVEQLLMNGVMEISNESFFVSAARIGNRLPFDPESFSEEV